MSSRARKQMKRRMEKMKNRIPMQVPRIGGAPQQITITAEDTIESKCKCGGRLFDIAYWHRVFPAVSPRNPTGKDQAIKIEVFVCRACGAVLGDDVDRGASESLDPSAG